MKISIKISNKVAYLIGNMVIPEDLKNMIIMDFLEGIL